MRKHLIFIFGILIFINLISAGSVSVWQGQYLTGDPNTLYTFNFTVFDSVSGGNICFSNETSLTTNSDRWWKTEQSLASSCNNASKDYFLEIRINGNLESDIDGTTRRRLTIWDYLRRDTDETHSGDLTLNGTLFGSSPLNLEQVISFVNLSKTQIFSIYRGESGQSWSNVSSDFDGVLIHEMDIVENPYAIEECWWDKDEQLMHFCINHGALKRATTIRRSFQVVGNLTTKENDRNFTLCEDANYVDCSTDVTGADLFVQDDIEAQSIYANENMTALNFLGSWNGSVDYVPYTGATSNVDLGNFNLTTSHIQVNHDADWNGMIMNRQSSANKNSEIKFAQQGSNQFTLGIDGNLENARNFYIYDVIATKYRFFINESGLVGIGTSNPSQRLTVGDGTGAQSVLVDGAVANAVGFRINKAGSTEWAILQNGNSEDLTFYSYDSGGGDVMTLTDEGNVGIGITNSDERLTVNGSMNLTGNFSGNQYYGFMNITEGSELISIATQNVWYNVTNYTVTEKNGFAADTYGIKALIPGRYLIYFDSTYTCTANTQYEYTVSVNYSPKLECKGGASVGVQNERENTAGSCILSLNVNDVVGIMVRNLDSTANPTIKDSHMTLLRVGG